MRTRPFGNTGLHVAEVGMGCNRLAEAQCPESHWIDLVREAVDPVSYTHLTLPTICSV